MKIINKILKGTFEYLVENSLEKAGIREICKYVGCQKDSIYYYYKDKDELLCSAAEYSL